MYYCANCGKNAKVNTPFYDSCGNIICDRCIAQDGRRLRGIDQITMLPNNTLQEGEFIVDKHKGYKMAWTDYGSRLFVIHEHEQVLTDHEIIDLMKIHRDKHLFRCTECGKTFHEKVIGGYPLFAGITCKDCWREKYLEGEKYDNACLKCGRSVLFCKCG